jgi:hypothetical protein
MCDDRTHVYGRGDCSPSPAEVPIQDTELGELTMNARTQALKQLVRDGRYVVDPDAVAAAIVARVLARRAPQRTSDEPGSSPAR